MSVNFNWYHESLYRSRKNRMHWTQRSEQKNCLHACCLPLRNSHPRKLYLLDRLGNVSFFYFFRYFKWITQMCITKYNSPNQRHSNNANPFDLFANFLPAPSYERCIETFYSLCISIQRHSKQKNSFLHKLSDKEFTDLRNIISCKLYKFMNFFSRMRNGIF